MSRYLERLKALVVEKRPSEEPTKLTKGHLETPEKAFVGFVSDPGSPFAEAEDAEAAVQERAGLAAGGVPAIYLDAWARLNCQKPFRGSDDEWRLALDDGGRFLDAWGEEAAALGWTPCALFDVGKGLAWRLQGARVEALGADHVGLNDGRILERDS